MKKTLLFISAILIFHISFSQELVKSGRQWSIINSGVGIGSNGLVYTQNTSYLNCKGDTIIGQITYKQIFSDDTTIDHNSIYIGGLREDTTEKKVYYIIDSVEHLLYDFSIQKGDTVNVWYSGFCEVPLIADSVDTVIINNVPLKRIVFVKAPTSPIAEIWIESIGSLFGLTNVAYDLCMADVGYELLCVHENDTLIYHNTSFNGCYVDTVIYVGITEKKTDYFDPNIYPNPITSIGTIAFNSSNNSSRLEIYTIDGVLLKQINVNGMKSYQIDSKEYKSGTYYYRLTDKVGNICNGKFVII